MSENDSPKTYNVCLMGASVDVDNLGVRALAGGLVQLVLGSRPGAKISLLYGNRTDGEREIAYAGGRARLRVVNYRLSPKARRQEHLFWILAMACLYRLLPVPALRRRISRSTPWIGALAEADFVGDIRGGDSFSDIYGLSRLVVGSAPALSALILGKELVLLPQTYGPFDSALARWVGRFIVRRAARLYSRDRESIEVVRELLGPKAEGKSARFCPDVAFVLEAAPPPEGAIDPPLPEGGPTPVIGLNVSGLLYVGGYTGKNMFGLRCDYKDFILALVRRILAETDARVLLVPHFFASGEEPEMPACEEVRSAFDGAGRERVHLLRGQCDQSQIKSLIGGCDFFIGSRMHACIAAMSQGVPSIGLAYSRKFAGVFDSIGVGDMVLDAREKERDELVAECLRRFASRGEVASLLRERMPRIQAEVRACFEEQLLGRAPNAAAGAKVEGPPLAALAERGG